MGRAWEDYLRVNGWDSEYPSVDRFLRHYRRRGGSERTRRNCLQTLYWLCTYSGLDPEGLVRLSPGEAGELVQGFLDSKMAGGRSVRYLNVSMAYLKTFFRINGFGEGNGLEVERYHQPTRYRKVPEYIPTPEEIERMAYAAGSKRNRALILVAYTSGLRNSTLRALRIRDVEDELGRGMEVVRIPVYPEMKDVDPAACKGNVPYYTFISREAVEALREYLEERAGRYGGPEPDEPLFCSETTNLPPDVRRRTPVKYRTLEEGVKRAARRAGVRRWMHVTPHSLRKAFESALRNGGLDVDDREFLMGHILPGSRDAYYDRSKVEELRAKYAGVRFFPRTTEADKLEMVKAFAKTLGIEEIEIKVARLKERMPGMSEDEAVGRVIREELIRALGEGGREGEDPRKVIVEDELERYLADGWDVQTVLPSGRILVRKVQRL